MSPPADPIAADFAHLRDMYKRYMLNPAVAPWLLARHTMTDFEVVRKENAVLVTSVASSAPEVVPRDVPQAPFPSVDDLHFLERVEGGFALGHVWGSLSSESHPYAVLAARADKCGWAKVHSRKFASDVTSSDALESVEYTWFTDNSAIVVLSRTPFAAAKRKVQISEVLFFAPVERRDIPPQRPELVLLVDNRALCTDCAKEVCSCPDAIGIKRGSLAELDTDTACRGGASGRGGGHTDKQVTCVKMSWENRMRMMCHGDKRGLMTVVYSSAAGRSYPRITVRQAYVSTCADQTTIAYRIQQQLTKLLARIPRGPRTQIRKSQSQDVQLLAGASTPLASAAQSTGGHSASYVPDLSTQSPISLNVPRSPLANHQKERVWFEPPKPNVARPDCSLKSSAFDTRPLGCSPKPPPIAIAKNVHHLMAAAKPDECSASPGSLPSMRSALDSFSRESGMQNSVCGPGKAGMDCDCSAENMQDMTLARILCSSRDLVSANLAAESPPSTELRPGSTGSTRVRALGRLHSIPKLNFESVEGVLRDVEKGVADNFSPSLQYGGLSPGSARVGVGTTLQSPLPPPLIPEEPPLKRPRGPPVSRPEALGLMLEPIWPEGSDDREKGIQLPSWNMSAVPERPLSALGRALGVARSPSPLTLAAGSHTTPSPRALPPAMGSVLPLPKLLEQEILLENPPSSNVIVNDSAHLRKPDRRHDIARRLHGIAPFQSPNPSGPCGSLNTSEGGATNGSEVSGGAGVCCEICGISFAKRSNKLRHIQTVHNRLKQFECDLCGTKFGLKADLGRHRFRIHESRAYCCSSCGKSFAEQSQLEIHYRVTHEEDSRPWECRHCHIRFGRKSSLTRHEQTVHQQARFNCRVCNKSYSQKFDATRHERKVHGFDDKPAG